MTYLFIFIFAIKNSHIKKFVSLYTREGAYIRNQVSNPGFYLKVRRPGTSQILWKYFILRVRVRNTTYIAMSGLLVSLIGPCRLVWVSRTEWCVSFGRIGTKFLSLDPLKSNPYCTKNKVLGSINPATVKSVNWYCTECKVWKSLVK